ncbi:MAG: DUF5777 family beta-barrel protein [Chitinophagaceae bacterium]
MMRKTLFFLTLLITGNTLFAQDSSLLKLLNDSLDVSHSGDVVTGTFKATQLINTPTVESPAKKNLQFLIMHRFGRLNEGSYALFGLDNATIRFGLDYGITDRLAIGIGRSSLDKTFDGSIKYKILQQKTSGMPLSLSIYELITTYTQKYTDKPFLNTKYRTAYTSALLIARKFSRNLSLQVVPSWLHFNMVPTPEDKNNVFAVTVGGRMKFTKRMSVNAEYNYLSSDQVASLDIHRSLSLGIDIETGGHVFQLVFSNSQGMVAPYYIARTTGTWGNGDIFFGFNVSRNFNFNKKRIGKW